VDARMTSLTQMILNAYREGVFPMAESADDEGFAFYKPHLRSLLPINDLHISSKLLKVLRRRPYNIRMNTAFKDIIEGCSARETTWINPAIINVYMELHSEGHAHSVECWDHHGHLAGGLYGLSIGAVFCGESMVSFQSDASKIALVHLCALLKECGYTTLDTQFINPHIARFGAYEMPQEDYEALIQTEMNKAVKPLQNVPLSHELLLQYLEAPKNQAMD
jgi:leucyl/phenylalanyl-tRNA--protein transferase